MAYRIEIAPRAQVLIKNARDYIARESPARAARWSQGLLKKLKTLKTRPFTCPRAPESEIRGAEIRELLYGKRRNVYRILFTVQGDTVRVLALWHSSRGESPF